jgi:menaquinol-cytochrome c reductase iron-sulfur subunit
VTFISGLAGLIVAIPLIGSLVGPSLQRERGHFTKVADMDALAIGQPIDVKYPDPTQDAYLRETVSRSVWVIKHSPTQVTVFSPICTHLGCRFFWDPSTQRFICPCHNSIFAMDGRVLGGPARRGLDTLPIRITSGELFVQWERFRPAIPEKVLA